MNPGRIKRATIKDVAALAKVSHPTASRVLNDRLEGYPLRDETIKRVREAAKRLSYRPNRSARSLRNQRSYYIGLSIGYLPSKQTNLERPHSELLARVGDGRTPFADIVTNMAFVGFERGYETVLIQREEAKEGRLNRRDLFPDTVDGLVYFMSTLQHQEYAEVAALGYPFVLADHTAPGIDIHSCNVDNEKAVYDLTNHLLERGVKRPLYIYNQALDWVLSEQRFRGYQCALIAAGVPFRLEDCHQGAIKKDDLRNWITRRLRDEPTIDGLLFTNFEAFNIVIESMAAAGRNAPEDLLVAGICDGFDPVVEQHGITCMHWPLGIIARRAAELLIDVIEGTVTETQHVDIEPILVTRGSTTVGVSAKV